MLFCFRHVYLLSFAELRLFWRIGDVAMVRPFLCTHEDAVDEFYSQHCCLGTGSTPCRPLRHYPVLHPDSEDPACV